MEVGSKRREGLGVNLNQRRAGLGEMLRTFTARRRGQRRLRPLRRPSKGAGSTRQAGSAFPPEGKVGTRERREKKEEKDEKEEKEATCGVINLVGIKIRSHGHTHLARLKLRVSLP